jgi:hypothetical protein
MWFLDPNDVPLVTSIIGLLGTIVTCCTALWVATRINRNLKQHETVFAHLHKKRAEVVETLFKKLMPMDVLLVRIKGIRRATTEQQRKKQEADFLAASEHCHAFLTAFLENRIFLDKHFCDKMMSEFTPAVHGFLDKIDNYVADSSGQDDENRKQLDDIRTAFESSIRPILSELEEQIRKMLGSK